MCSPVRLLVLVVVSLFSVFIALRQGLHRQSRLVEKPA
jgi:hypothetical protein